MSLSSGQGSHLAVKRELFETDLGHQRCGTNIVERLLAAGSLDKWKFKVFANRSGNHRCVLRHQTDSSAPLRHFGASIALPIQLARRIWRIPQCCDVAKEGALATPRRPIHGDKLPVGQ